MYTAAQLELPEHLELADVVREANRLLELSPDLADSSKFSERTIYYYVQKKLLPRRAHRGPGTTYPASYVHRLLFIRLLQKQGLSLDDIRDEYLIDAVNRLPDETIVSILRGEEPLELRYAGAPEAAVGEPLIRESSRPKPDAARLRRKPVSAKDRRAWLQRGRESSEKPLPSFMRPADKKAVRRDAIFASAEPDMDVADEDKAMSYSLGPDAELVFRRELTPSQKRRLEHIAALIVDILEEKD